MRLGGRQEVGPQGRLTFGRQYGGAPLRNPAGEGHTNLGGEAPPRPRDYMAKTPCDSEVKNNGV